MLKLFVHEPIESTHMKFIFNPLVPELDASDFARSLEFYTSVLGFKIEYQREERGFAMLSYQGSQIMLEQYNGNWNTGQLEYPYGRGINFSIATDEVDLIVERLQKAGHPILMMPTEAWYRKDDVLLGERHILVQDPDGYLLRFAEDLGTKPVDEAYWAKYNKV